MTYETAAETEARVVARVRLPLQVSAITRISGAVYAVYGTGCTCKQEPPYWMTFYKPQTKAEQPKQEKQQ